MNAKSGALLSCLPHPPKYEYDWQGLGQFPELAAWFSRLADTPQNPEWHGEGDVWAHTRLVCDALAGLGEFRAMQPPARDALALAALLHDIGKPVTNRMEDGAWASPRHGPVGARLARKLLWQDFGMCGEVEAQRFREAVCLLIRGHTKPPHLVTGDDATRTLLLLAANGELAPAFTLKSLCLLAEADVLGRIALDNPEFLDRVALARELIREEGCLEGPYPFGSVHTQRTLFAGGSVWRDQALYDDTWGEVTLTCGLPGTGKDAWIRANCPGLPVVSLDDVRLDLDVLPTENQGRVVQAARERAKALLRERQPFVWNATSLTSLRGQQVDLFERYGARVRIVFLETEWEENLRRNADRPGAVPEDVIDRMLGRMEPPGRGEAQAVEWLCV